MSFYRLPERSQTRDIVDTFRGYNHNRKIADGEWHEMENMSPDHYPLTAVRPRRGNYAAPTAGGGILCKDTLWWVDGPALTNGTDTVNLGLSDTTPDKPKRLVGMGAYIIVWPDRKYLNTVDLTWGNMDREFTTGDFVTVRLCRADGSEYSKEYVSETEPQTPENMAVWVDTSQYPNRLLQWSEASHAWTQVPVTTVKIISPEIGAELAAGDSVVISGFKQDYAATDCVTGEPVTAQQQQQLGMLDGPKMIVDCNWDMIVIEGVMDVYCKIPTMITIRRQAPLMDYIAEHGNRLWGCRYGHDRDGAFVNTIYASKLSDFKNWQCYQGVDTDSYYANVGTDGPFTGVISYGGNLVFSKENAMHLVYGGGPSEFQVQAVTAKGVQSGSDRSMAVVNGVLYYKSSAGVCAYDGSLPADIGSCFGGVRYRNAAAGSYGSKYYLAMDEVTTGQRHLFVYDTERRLWFRENGRAHCFADGGHETYFQDADGCIRTIGGSGDIAEGAVRWHGQTGIIGAETPDRKRLQRLNIRCQLAVGAWMRILVRYDSTSAWRQVGRIGSQTLRAIDFPVRVRRCDHLELRFEGMGECHMHSIVKTYETGSDRR